MRAATHWRTTQLDGKTIQWIEGTEGTGRRICSVLDPESAEPNHRRMADGSRQELPDDPGTGLIVYGTHKWDRPTFAGFSADEQYGYLVKGIEDGRGVCGA